MGGGRWDPGTWTAYSSTVAHKTVDKIYASRRLHKDLDPNGITVRESRDSTDHPESTAVIVGLDVTGSMGMLAETMAKKGLGILVEQINERQPVKDPHTMIMAIGDVHIDNAPLQVTQFESSNVLIEQLEKIYVEHGGGGNNTESYDAPWYFAAQHTSIDCFEKRNKKGYLFTIGDEESPAGITVAQVKEFFGDEIDEDLSAKALLAMAQRMYNVFHVVAEEGNHARNCRDLVYSSWRKLLGQHVLPLSDHTKLAEVIVSTIQIIEGESAKKVADSWDGKTAVVVANATRGLVTGSKTTTKGGVVRLS
jgi:hypothetical protein